MKRFQEMAERKVLLLLSDICQDICKISVAFLSTLTLSMLEK